jgi:hypothetical protein
MFSIDCKHAYVHAGYWCLSSDRAARVIIYRDISTTVYMT